MFFDAGSSALNVWSFAGPASYFGHMSDKSAPNPRIFYEPRFVDVADLLALANGDAFPVARSKNRKFICWAVAKKNYEWHLVLLLMRFLEL